MNLQINMTMTLPPDLFTQWLFFGARLWGQTTAMKTKTVHVTVGNRNDGSDST
jgi:hypothetical protein